MRPSSPRLLRLALGFGLGAAVIVGGGCKTPDATGGDAASLAASTEGGREGLKFCAGIRGNGNLIFAHFASLARITEHYGLLDAASGGSSASITIFVYESMRMSPAVRRCGERACTAAEQAERMAFLLKSVEGYGRQFAATEEMQALRQLASVAQAVVEKGLDAAIEDPKATVKSIEPAVRDLRTVLESPEIRGLVNRELLTMIARSEVPVHQAREALAAVQALGAWSVDDERIFFRAGAIDFEALAARVGRMGSFYAGYEPADPAALGVVLDQCAASARGKEWAVAGDLPGPNGKTCGAAFEDLVASFRKTLLAGEARYRSRIDDPIGATLPALVSTSVLEGEAVMAELAAARERYRRGEAPAFRPSFEDLRFGYWGRAADLARVGRNPLGLTDLKTRKFLSLGEASWRVALALSPAEPSLARILDIDAKRASVGGWSDLHPTLVLKSLGCENVLYVSRQGDESVFAIGVARHMGLTDDDQAALYELDRPSSYTKSIEAASVWCSNWNAFDTFATEATFRDAYNAPLEARTAFFQGGTPPYPGAKRSVGLRGCTPGWHN